MDRIALAKRLESLSSVFASHTPYNRDLKAMSYVLSKLSDDKFQTILSGDFNADEHEACMCGAGPGPAVIPMGAPADVSVGEPEEEKKIIVIKTDGGMPMSAEATEKTAGMFWCKEASQAVVDNLLRDVVAMNKSVCCDTGRHLEKEQIPDGTHAGLPERGVALKPEQTPEISESLDSDMVQKSHGAVEKEAGSKKGPGVPDGTGPHAGTSKCQMNEEKEASLADIKKKKEEAEKAKLEKDVKDLKKAKKEKKASDEDADSDEANKDDKAAAEDSSSSFEGIELVASMDEVELDANEASELSKLFE